MSFGPAVPDELPGYVKRSLPLPAEDDGRLTATLVYAEGTLDQPQSGVTVLYLHGFVDYFFQTHVAEAFRAAGHRFFALDLRRYGRSLQPTHRPNYARQVSEYDEEISAAIEFAGGGGPVTLLAHSTGGLIASLYAKHGNQRSRVQRLILNSPFFRFPTRGWLEFKLRFAREIGKRAPRSRLPQRLNRVYGMTIHSSQQGSFSYDLTKKPLDGFPFYGGWVDMILSAQEEVEQGLDLDLPILCLHSAHSRVAGAVPVPEDFRADTVLRVEDIARLAPRLGSGVLVEAIPGGLHDLTLSAPEVRRVAIQRMVDFASDPGGLPESQKPGPAPPR